MIRKWWLEFLHWLEWRDEWAEDCEICNPDLFKETQIMTTLEKAKDFLIRNGVINRRMLAEVPGPMAEFADQLLAERDAEIDSMQARCLDLEKTLGTLIRVVESVQTETKEDWVSRCLADAVNRSQTAMDFADSVIGETK